MNKDRIILRGLSFHGYHGVFPEERSLGQKFQVDLDLYMDLAAAGSSDGLDKSVSYAEVFEQVRHVVEGSPFLTVEALAQAIAARVFMRFGLIESLQVAVVKPAAPIPGSFDQVGVEIFRDRRRDFPWLLAAEGENVCFVALGGNLGNREKVLTQALQRLASHPAMTLHAHSGFYNTSPVGVADQEDFLNGAALLTTSLGPEALLENLLQIESELGRERSRSVERWGPRFIDLDLLLYNDRVMHSDFLTLPHPRMYQRLFVLVPMAEIAPHWRHPGGFTTQEALEKLCLNLHISLQTPRHSITID